MAKFYYGGQAVIEGVMMRGQRHMAVAVRTPQGTITVYQEPLNNALYTHPLMKLPVLRGLVALWDALGLGIKALMFSADAALREEDGQEGQQAHVGEEMQGAAATTTLPFVPMPSHNRHNTAELIETTRDARQESVVTQEQARNADKAFSGPAAWSSIAIALLMMVGVFFVLPVLAASLFTGIVGMQSSLAHNVIEGVIRLSLFLAYIWGIGHMRDVQRVFGYHGAEHKTINAYEAAEELTPERVQRFTLLNPRCGTTFLLIVMLLATIVFVLIGKLPFAFMLLSRVLLVPVIAAFAYEFIRLMAGLYDLAIVRAIMAPGLALQKMTTRPPDLSMLEVAIAALNAVLVADGVARRPEPAPAHSTEQTEEPITTMA